MPTYIKVAMHLSVGTVSASPMRGAYYGGPAHDQFGPGLMTPVVKALLYANVGVFLVTLVVSVSFW